MRVFLVLAVAFFATAIVTPTSASQVTISKDGINSAGLLGLNGMPLTGSAGCHWLCQCSG